MVFEYLRLIHSQIPKGGLRHIRNGVHSLDSERESRMYKDKVMLATQLVLCRQSDTQEQDVPLDETREHILRLADFRRNVCFTLIFTSYQLTLFEV